MAAEDMHLFGLRVDCSYQSKVQITDMNMKETCAEFYKRMYNITRLLIREVGGAEGGQSLCMGICVYVVPVLCNIE